MARKKKTDNTPIENNVLKDLGKIEREKYADVANKWHNIDDGSEPIENELSAASLDDYSDDIHSVLENHKPINGNDIIEEFGFKDKRIKTMLDEGLKIAFVIPNITKETCIKLLKDLLSKKLIEVD